MIRGVTHNTVTVFLSDDALDLAARRLALLLMPDDDPELLAALWDALADDYAEAYPGGVTAGNCRKKADHYRGIKKHEPDPEQIHQTREEDQDPDRPV